MRILKSKAQSLRNTKQQFFKTFLITFIQFFCLRYAYYTVSFLKLFILNLSYLKFSGLLLFLSHFCRLFINSLDKMRIWKLIYMFTLLSSLNCNRKFGLISESSFGMDSVKYCWVWTFIGNTNDLTGVELYVIFIKNWYLTNLYYQKKLRKKSNKKDN